ncbi:hypothetical protein K0M31_013299 [Melipona bicolor]|uniref:Uncharacterized protein n=1 Tax=Melipona bicolor TaxID=60889 RepID=A0AA40FIF9_9HYME|nr:hypothetical protein K0M31_013299 [Melipona bicolor]
MEVRVPQQLTEESHVFACSRCKRTAAETFDNRRRRVDFLQQSPKETNLDQEERNKLNASAGTECSRMPYDSHVLRGYDFPSEASSVVPRKSISKAMPRSTSTRIPTLRDKDPVTFVRSNPLPQKFCKLRSSNVETDVVCRYHTV